MKAISKWTQLIEATLVMAVYIALFHSPLSRHFGERMWWYVLPWCAVLLIWGIINGVSKKSVSLTRIAILLCLASIISDLSAGYVFSLAHGLNTGPFRFEHLLLRSIVLNLFWGRLWFIYLSVMALHLLDIWMARRLTR